MKTIFQIIRKELLQFRHDRKMFGLSFIAPMVQLIILGYAANLDVKHISTIICDQDRTPESRALVSNFAHTEYFDLNYYLDDARTIDELIDHGHASLALVVPRGFGNKIAAGKTAPVQLLSDGAEASVAATGLNYASIIVLRHSQNILLEKLERLKFNGWRVFTLDAETRVWYNPELKSRNFMIPGVLALLLMVMTMLLTSLAIVKEKEAGTMEQLIVTPIKPYQLMIGKIAPFIGIGIIDIVIVILVATFWFDIPVKGNIFLLFALTTIFLMTTLGLGLFVSTVSRTQQQAMMTAMFFVMLPMIFLSGFVFPIENMPKVVQFFTYFMPLRYFFVIVRGLFLKGVGLAALWDQAVILLGFGLVIFSLSALRFRKKIG